MIHMLKVHENNAKGEMIYFFPHEKESTHTKKK